MTTVEAMKYFRALKKGPTKVKRWRNLQPFGIRSWKGIDQKLTKVKAKDQG